MNQMLPVSSFLMAAAPPPSFDGLQLSVDQTVMLQIVVSEFRAAQSRIAGEFVVLCSKLATMKEILGDKFQRFAEQELDLSGRTIQRYLALHDVMRKHLATDGRIDVQEARMFTKGALKLLSPVTDEDIIDEVRQLAQAGREINEATIKKIVEARNVDFQERITLAESEAARASQELEAVQQRRQIENAQSQAHINRQDEIIRRREEQVAALEEDVQRLTSQATVVTEVEKEVVPEGYSSIAEALADVESQLKHARAELHDATMAREAQERVSEQMQEQISQLAREHTDFMAIKAKVDEVLQLLPEVHLQTLNLKDPTVKKAMNAMGATLIEFGKHLQAAALVAA